MTRWRLSTELSWCSPGETEGVRNTITRVHSNIHSHASAVVLSSDGPVWQQSCEQSKLSTLWSNLALSNSRGRAVQRSQHPTKLNYAGFNGVIFDIYQSINMNFMNGELVCVFMRVNCTLQLTSLICWNFNKWSSCQILSHKKIKNK